MTESAEQPEAEAIAHWYDPDGSRLTLTGGDGALVYDEHGNEFLDCTSQLYCVNAGHGNEAIIEGMYEQMEDVQYVAPLHDNDVRTELARRLVDVAPDSLSDVVYSLSGSESNELAAHIARSYGDAPKVLTRWRSYHGSTYGAGSFSGDPQTRAALERYASTTGTVKFLPPMSYRSPFDADTPEDLAAEAADHLEFVVKNEGPDSIAAVLTESIAGTSGAYTAPPGYFERVREICDEYDILLVADEVLTGFGRCGDWFGIQTEDVDPDMMTFAKGVTGAYAPLGGVMLSEDVSEFVRSKGLDIGQTFGGHPVSCAAGVAAIEEYRNGLLDNVRDLSPLLEERLREVGEAHDVVGDVRGRGFLWTLEIVDPETGAPIFDSRIDDGRNPLAYIVAAAARDHGALFLWGRPEHQLMVAPPFCVDRSDVERIASALDGAIESVRDRLT